AEGKKMQDLLALRITLYFTDDVELVYDYFRNQPNFDSESVDAAESMLLPNTFPCGFPRAPSCDVAPKVTF
ncbi:hypothetical protein, partial [uncultured Senegalimassilia sp.]|uniref:hypothetical protein n=1 Tax=uncultured Senegalimassilia sp. TaxID=1714350 RepID=UPI0025D0E20A